MGLANSRVRELAELDFHRNSESPETDRLYHLADGIILSIGPKSSRLMDLPADDDVKVDFRYVETLERLGRGFNLAGYESAIPLLLRTGVIEEGPARPDHFIREGLLSLDHYYLSHYRHRLSERALHAYEVGVDVHARRKRFFQQVGQCPVLPETALRRALLVGDAQEVGPLKVLCLGDDDLVSVPLAVLGHEVTVYDIDDYLLEFLGLAAADRALSIEIQEVDLRDPLRKNRREYFDVVLTDPMSNRDCFELFLSRALSMLKPNGICFSACFPPTTELFHSVAREMHFEIEEWYARHNRYYTHFVKQHAYESDWVRIRKTSNTMETVPPDEFCVPLNLYREDYHQRLPVFAAEIVDIDVERLTRPMFLDLLLDAVQAQTGIAFRDRTFRSGDAWSLAIAFSDRGRVTVHADRAAREIVVEMYPFVPELERPLRTSLMSVFKSEPRDVSVVTNNALWAVRIR